MLFLGANGFPPRHYPSSLPTTMGVIFKFTCSWRVLYAREKYKDYMFHIEVVQVLALFMYISAWHYFGGKCLRCLIVPYRITSIWYNVKTLFAHFKTPLCVIYWAVDYRHFRDKLYDTCDWGSDYHIWKQKCKFSLWQSAIQGKQEYEPVVQTRNCYNSKPNSSLGILFWDKTPEKDQFWASLQLIIATTGGLIKKH